MLFSSHVLSEVEEICDRVIILQAGKLVETVRMSELRHQHRIEAVIDDNVDMVEFEKQRIRGAIRTDAILSAEIIVIVLGTVKDADLVTRIAVLSVVAALITIGIYGLVAAIVKLDDVGMHLIAKPGESGWIRLQRWFGAWVLRMAQKLMRLLSVLGTAAMFLVGGGILVHGVPVVAELLHYIEEWAHAVAGGVSAVLANVLFVGVFGVIAGGILVGVGNLVRKLLPRKADASAG